MWKMGTCSQTNEVKNSNLSLIVRDGRLLQHFYSDYDLPKIIQKNMKAKNYHLMKNTSLIVPGKCLL